MFYLLTLFPLFALSASALTSKSLDTRAITIPGASDPGISIARVTVMDIDTSTPQLQFEIRDELKNNNGESRGSWCRISLPGFVSSNGGYTSPLPAGAYHACDSSQFGFNFTGSGTDGFDLFVSHT